MYRCRDCGYIWEKEQDQCPACCGDNFGSVNEDLEETYPEDIEEEE